MNIDFLNNIQENIEKKFETLKEDISDNLIDEASKKLGLDNEEFSLDRFEENRAILENRKTNEMIEVDRNRIPKDAKEGDILKFIDNEFKIDMELTNQKSEEIKEKMNKFGNNIKGATKDGEKKTEEK